MTWHEEVLDAAGLRAAARLARLGRGFYLAGGTGLALRLGHRVSLDLDLFTRESALDGRERSAILEALRSSGPVDVKETSDGTLHLILGGTRVSLLRYRYPLVSACASWRGVKVASRKDIAAMKVSAIVGRGSRRDFIDLYALARREGLESLLLAARKKFAEREDFLLHAARALVFFDDAEREPLPRLLKPLDWNTLKAYFIREAPRLIRGAL